MFSDTNPKPHESYSNFPYPVQTITYSVPSASRVFLIGMLIFVRQSAVWSQVYMDERLWIMLDELLMLRTEGSQNEDDGGKNQSDIKQYDQHRV